MLNEWIETNSKLKSFDCDFGESHPYFKPCPSNKKGFIVFLDHNGNVEDADIPDFSMGTVYRWQKGKMDPSFPVFNGRAFYEVICDPKLVPKPISHALKEKKSPKNENNKDIGVEMKVKQNEIVEGSIPQSFIEGCNDLWKEDLKLIGKCLNELPSELQYGLSEFSVAEFKGSMSPEGLIQAIKTGSKIDFGVVKIPITSLNEFLESKDLYRFMTNQSDEAKDSISRIEQLSPLELKRLNRSLIEANYPSETPMRQCLESIEVKDRGYGIYKELVRRAGLCKPEKFLEDVRKIFVQKLIETGKKEFAEVLFAFKKEGKKKGRGKEHGKDFLFLLSIKDWDNPVYGQNRFPPHHRSFQKWMAQVFEKHSKELYRPIGVKDAFGLDMAGAKENYDDIDTPLGQIKLFAAFKGNPCLKRYGLESFELFPAGRDARELGRKTLIYVLARSKEGITWTSLRKYENRNTVAFAYCTKIENVNAIKVFDNDDTNEQENIYISEESTKTVLKTFEGIAESEPSAEIVIGIIAAVDPGNTKVLASRHYPLKHYLSGAQLWQKGCANIPEVFLPWIVKKGKILKGALPIYPSRAVWLLNSSWRQNGDMITRKQGSQKVPISKRFNSSDAMDFLFESEDTIRARVDSGLENILYNSAHALIMAKLKATMNQYGKKDKISFKDSDYLHMLPTLYGLLLHKKGIRKEVYMNEDLFYLGRFFAVVDKLHIQYSLDVRNGDVPLRLIGNDHVSLALQNPLEAFVSLGRRVEHPYISWAKRVKPNEIPRRAAKNCLKDIAEITGRLIESQIPNEIDDAGKAKLILGYLSYGAKEEEAQTDSSSTEITNNNQGGK